MMNPRTLLALMVSALSFIALPIGVAMAQSTDVAAGVNTLREEIAAVRGQQVRLQANFEGERQDRRRLQGEIEEIGFNFKRLEGRLDKLVGDLDLRLQEIEDALDSVAPETPMPDASAQPSTPETALAPKNATASTITGSLGQLVVDANGNTLDATSATEQNFVDRYDQAIKQIQLGQYTMARQAFEALHLEDPKHALSSNVLYWLGETYYVENNYEHAMSQFARVALQFPDGAKYLDSLLKIGLSLGSLGRLEEACKTLGDMAKRADKLPGAIALNRKKALERFGCSG